MSAREVLSKPSKKTKTMGTPIAEYSEEGPFHCEDCILQKPISDKRGACKEPHVLTDMKKGLIKKDKKSGLAEINLEHGCCRWIQMSGK